MKNLFSLLALIAKGVLAQTPPPATTGSVSGIVIDADTRMPIPGARVGSSALGWTLTYADGRYTIVPKN